MRASLKRAVESVLVRGGAAWAVRRRLSGRPAILAYHYVVPDDVPPQGDRSLHVPFKRFARQLDLLCETHEVRPLDSLRSGDTGASERPTAAITFDDAYRGAVTLAVEELARRGLPATIFVAPGLLGDRSFWWDDLAAQDGSGLSDRLRRTALDELSGRESLIRERARQERSAGRPLPAVMRSASEGELGDAARQPGITLGAHSWSHPNLARLRSPELDSELGGPLDWLRSNYSTVIDWLAYPYGRTSPEVERAARAAGYAGSVLNDGGLAPGHAVDLLGLPRVNVPAGLSDDGFVLRCAGLRL
ncbi:MAG: polysaccharide deacetylase family protein [Gemmatimonadota bacterium]|nr:MAG: polysaccharide deacetylase family protein [Gemmatimonadota bacterium]